MKEKSFWEKIGMHDWFLKKEDTVEEGTAAISPNDIYHFIIQQFRHSITQLSFANRVVFYHEYMIAFNPEDYKDFMGPKGGIFLHIVEDCVNEFYSILKAEQGKGKKVVPSSSKWVFRFVSHPEYNRGDKGFIGKLLPGQTQQQENLKVTFIPRQSRIAETFDINPEILKGFHHHSDGYFELPFKEDLVYDKASVKKPAAALAKLEAIVPDKELAGKKIEFLVLDEEVIVSGKSESNTGRHIFRIPTDWINTPHLKIRFQSSDSKLYVASFGEKTVLNEKPLPASTEAQPLWTELPMNSKLVLNGIAGINVFKS